MKNNEKTHEWAVALYRSRRWRKIRYEVIRKYGGRCMCCGRTPEHGVVINVDHIKPVRQYPDLAFDFSNLQVLCEDCNAGKGGTTWDFRQKGAAARYAGNTGEYAARTARRAQEAHPFDFGPRVECVSGEYAKVRHGGWMPKSIAATWNIGCPRDENNDN